MTEDEANAIMANYGRYHGDADAATPSTIAAVIKAEAQFLTEKQHAALAAAVSQTGAGDGWSTGMLRRQYDIVTAANPALITKVPSARELFVALGGDEKEPQARIELWRKLEHLDDQARLDLAPAPVKKAEPEKPVMVETEKPVASPYTDDIVCDDELARRMGARDRFELRSKTTAAKLRAFRQALRASTTAPAAPTSAAAVMAAKGAKDWSEITDPQRRLRLYRQHQAETGSQ